MSGRLKELQFREIEARSKGFHTSLSSDTNFLLREIEKRDARIAELTREIPPTVSAATGDEKQPSAEAMEAARSIYIDVENRDGWCERKELSNYGLTQVARALDAFAARSRWQPIETYDGKQHERVLVARPQRREIAFIGSSGKWKGALNVDLAWVPTHWQPLPWFPEPPSCP